jgi:hypothetical protein
MPRRRKSAVEAADRMPISFRVPPALKDQLDHAAAESGRSLSQEIEIRLVESVRRDDLLGGRENRRIVLAMAAAFSRAVEVASGGQPNGARDPDAYACGVAAVLRTLLMENPTCSTHQVARALSQMQAEIQARKTVDELMRREDAVA